MIGRAQPETTLLEMVDRVCGSPVCNNASTMTILRIFAAVVGVLMVLVVGYLVYAINIANPRVERELIENPHGERAARVMLLTLPGGRRIPVNYYREDGMVYAGADGPWWKDLTNNGGPVTVLIRGETLQGHGRAIEDDPAYTERVFAKLRPNAVKGFGILVEIKLNDADEQ